ncbi:hypothetical protein ACRCJU_02820 [Aerococcus urinaeequi]|uniref:hypothetical protein n=1 Tax=Aerococcus urinaeequi TaxID=51665 RepID=UPI003D6BB519
MVFWTTVLIFFVGILALLLGFSLGENNVHKEYTDRMVKFALDLEYIKSKLK